MIMSGMIVLSHIWKVWKLHLGDNACLRNLYHCGMPGSFRSEWT
ncbi:unnamed protein product [Brassica rapa subsp. trilocularis]